MTHVDEIPANKLRLKFNVIASLLNSFETFSKILNTPFSASGQRIWINCFGDEYEFDRILTLRTIKIEAYKLYMLESSFTNSYILDILGKNGESNGLQVKRMSRNSVE